MVHLFYTLTLLNCLGKKTKQKNWDECRVSSSVSSGVDPQHLVQWDAGNPECLLQLVKELIQQYHHYQCQRLRESSRLLFEYDSLLEDPNYGRSMEIYAGHKNSWVRTTAIVLCVCGYLQYTVSLLQLTDKHFIYGIHKTTFNVSSEKA